MCRPALRHQRQQADRLQRDRLAAGVWARDDDDRVVVADRDVDRDDVSGQQRVPALDEIEPDQRWNAGRHDRLDRADISTA